MRGGGLRGTEARRVEENCQANVGRAPILRMNAAAV
jgi:hypothetical protein